MTSPQQRSRADHADHADAGAPTDPAARALRRALAALAKRDLSRQQVAAQLARAGFAAAVVEQTLARLEGWHYLDDQRLAARLVQAAAGRGHGLRRSQQQLRRRGLALPADPDLGRQAERDAGARAAATLRRRRPDLASPQGRGRALRFLAGRGFDAATCHSIVAAVRAQQSTEAAESAASHEA